MLIIFLCFGFVSLFGPSYRSHVWLYNVLVVFGRGKGMGSFLDEDVTLRHT